MANCCICARPFTQKHSQHRVCGPECAILDLKQRKVAKTQRAVRKQTRASREALKTLSQLANEAQKEVNAYVRERDKRLPCISCGQSSYHGQRHAGHYRTRAAAPQLRFNLWGLNAQCAQCNNSKSGNITEYRIGLVKKIGVERVEALENSNGKAGFTRDYLLRVKDVFRRRTRHLKKLRSKVREGGY